MTAIMPDIRGVGHWENDNFWIIDCLYCGAQYGYWPRVEWSGWWEDHKREHVANQVLNMNAVVGARR